MTEHVHISTALVDLTRWPLVRMRPPSGVSADGADIVGFCRDLEQMLLMRKRPFVVLYDVRGLRVSAARRDRLIEWASRNDAAIREHLIAMAFVIGSELERADVTSAFWSLKHTYHASVFDTESDAERWLLSEFARGEGAN